jgi:WD40 repeat protein
MRKSYRNFAARLTIALLIASARSMSAQGSPDILWQGTHTGYVRYTAFSPDGQQLASGGDDKRNKLWQASDGTLLRTITHCSGLGCSAPTFGRYSPDSQQLATSGVKFWRTSDGTLIRTLPIGGTLAFSSDFQSIASSITTSSYPSQNRSISLFRASDGSQVWTKPSAGGGATSFSPDGQLLASIGFQGIDIFQASDGTLVRNIVGPRGSFLAFSRDGQLIATNGGSGGSYRYDETIKIYRVSDGSLVRTFTATGVVTSIVFTPDGQTMIASSWDSNEDPVNGFLPSTGTIRLWRVSDGALLRTYDQNTGTSANALSVSADGQFFGYSHESTVVVARIPTNFCAFSISPTDAHLPENGGSGSVNVTAAPGCSWTASSRVDWITLTGNTSGTGNGTVTFTTSDGADGITGLLIIAEQAFPVHLGSDPCGYVVSPTSATWSSFGGTGGVGVQTLSGCGWTATTNDSWITITKINRDSGNGGLTYVVAPNSGPARTGTLTVAGQTVTIEQVTTACSYDVSPDSQSFGSTGGSGGIAITTLNGCPWTATTDVDWITLGVANGSGSGSATVTYWVNGNETLDTRTATITVAGHVTTITQEGITCSYDISPANRTFTADGGSDYVNMAAADACNWTATSDDSWITITAGGSGSGWGTIYYSVAENTSGSPRTGTISIVGQTFTIFQTSEAMQGSPDILWTGDDHSAQVNAVAFSPDGQLLASASDDGTVKIWRVSDGALLDTLTGHYKEVTSVAFSHNGEMLASGSMDRSINLWRVSDRTLIRTMGSSEFILGISFSPDDAFLTSGGGYSTNEIKVWRLSDGELLSITHDMLGQTNSVAYSPDGQLLAAGKANSVTTLRNMTTWNVDWLGQRGSINFVAFSPDGQLLATASDDKSVGLWQVTSGLRLFELNGPSGFVKSVGFSPDGEMMIAAGQDYGANHGAILFWRVSDGSLLRAYNQQTSTAVLSAQFSPDGSVFGFGRADGKVVVARNLLNVGPTPTPTPPPGATPTPTPEPTSTPEPTPEPTATPEATPTPGSSPEPTSTPAAPAQPLNISTRAQVLGNENALIGGFILTGPDSKQVVIRALGPSLGANGMPGALEDTTLDLFDSSGHLLASNDNWKDAQQSQIQNTGVAPSDALESALVMTLNGNSAYTAVVRGKSGGTGIGLVEVYDLGLGSNSRLGNISTRGLIEQGDNVMIGGFIVGGSAADRTGIVVRAIGPSLSGLGVSNALSDPTLTLYDSNGSVIGTNDNWREAHQPEIEAAGLAPADDREAALFASLAPGAYTAIVAGKANTTGIGLVEAYHVQ